MTERGKKVFWVVFLVATTLMSLAYILWPGRVPLPPGDGPMFDPGMGR